MLKDFIKVTILIVGLCILANSVGFFAGLGFAEGVSKSSNVGIYVIDNAKVE